jgi:hypothetical protein
VGDLNGDGKPDLAVASAMGGVFVLLGKGDGTFQPAVNYAAGGFPGSLAVGDFNGDGKADLAVANVLSHDVSILLGKGDGTLQPEVRVGQGSSPNSVAAATLGGSGKPDLVLGTNLGVSILLNRCGSPPHK